MSSKNPSKPCVTVRQSALLTLVTTLVAGVSPLGSVADQTISTDATLTADVSGKLTVENGASVRIGESLTVGSYAINSGTLTIAAGKTFEATESVDNFLGYGDGNHVEIVLEEGATFKDTHTRDNNAYRLYPAYYGSTANITVNRNAHLNLDWKYFYPNWNPSNERRDTNKLTVNLFGKFTLGEFETMEWYYNSGAANQPRTWPTNTIINIHSGGLLEARNIHRKSDTAQMLLNFNGGALKFRWNSTFLPSGGQAPALVLNFADGTTSTLDTDGHEVTMTGDSGKCFIEGTGSLNKAGNGILNISNCQTSDFTGDIYLTGGTLNFPIVADGIARKVYFQGGALSVPENGTFVTVANGGSVEFVSVDGAAIRLVSNGNAKLCPAGSAVKCSGTGSPVFEGTFAPGGEIQCGSDSDGAFGVSLPAGVAYGKVGAGTDTLVVNGLSSINIHEGKLRTDKFRFYRWVVDAKSGGGDTNMQIAEMIVWDANGQVNYSEKGCSASQYGTVMDGQGPEHAIDGYLNKWFDFHSISAGNCWLQLEFPEPIQLTGYAWFTADDCCDTNSSDCRSPSAWHWLASTDGVNWTEVARETNFTAPSTENTQAGYWGFGSTDISGVFASSTITIDSDASLLIDKAETVKVGNIFGNGGAVELTQAGSVLDVGADYTTYLVGGGITGPGSVEKTGSGTTRANGVNTYTGDTVVAAGTYAIVPSQTAAPKFFRFTFQNANGGAAQFAWLKLCASDGTIQSTGLTDAGVGVAAASLAAGKFSRVTDFEQWGDGDIANVFDGSDDTKYGGSAGPNQIVMRLADSAKTVVSYDVMTGSDDWESLYYYGGSRRLTNFKLEASLDGNTWQTVSEVNVTDRTEANKAWYSGTACGYAVRHFTGTSADATIPTASTVEVKPGATLAFETSTTISKLRLDLDIAANAASPVIEGLCPAVNGTLYVVTSDVNTLGDIAAKRTIPVKLNLQSLSPAAARTIRKWECKVNGVRTPYRLKAEEGADSSRLTWGSGMTIIIR